MLFIVVSKLFIGSTEVDVSFEYFISIVDQSDVDQKKSKVCLSFIV